jgi:hypothetical protein
MKLKTTVIISTVKGYLTRSICGLLVMFGIWQGLLVTAPAWAGVSVEEVVVPEGVGNNRANIVKQLAEKEKLEEEKAKSALKNPAKSLLEISETGMEIDADKAEKFSGDTPTIVKKTADRNSKQAEKFSVETTQKIKDLLK